MMARNNSKLRPTPNKDYVNEFMGYLDDDTTNDNMTNENPSQNQSPENTIKNNEEHIVNQTPAVVETHTPTNNTFFQDIRKNIDPLEVRSYSIKKSITEAFNQLTIDPATNKKIPGAKGLISKIVNNAIIRELVSIGLMPIESLDKIEEY